MAATYLNRPVFDWPLDWTRNPGARIQYDLREIDLGFGAEAYWGDQIHVVHGWRFEVPLDGEASIEAMDRWWEALQGRYVGFWLPTPAAAAVVHAAGSNMTFTVRDSNLADVLASRPELHLWFTRQGCSPMAAQVATVTGEGIETVTLAAATPLPVEPGWQVGLLEYVRLAEDEERGGFDAEQRMTRSIRVVELPHAYAAVETGAAPVYLYHFQTDQGGAPVEWRFTSFAWDLEIGGVTWTAARITHARLTRNTRGDREEVEVLAEFEPGNPLYQLCPCALAMPLNLGIRAAAFSDPVNQRILFTGRVLAVQVEGRTVTARCAAFLDLFDGALPHFHLQARCNYRVYQPETCRADLAAFQTQGQISALNGREVVVSGSGLVGLAAQWLAEGWIEVGVQDRFERRTILASTAETAGSLTLTLHLPLFYASAGEACVLAPGCDGRAVTCRTKFGNFVNFGGHGQALKNLTLKALEIPELDTGKK